MLIFQYLDQLNFNIDQLTLKLNEAHANNEQDKIDSLVNEYNFYSSLRAKFTSVLHNFELQRNNVDYAAAITRPVTDLLAMAVQIAENARQEVLADNQETLDFYSEQGLDRSQALERLEGEINLFGQGIEYAEFLESPQEATQSD